MLRVKSVQFDLPFTVVTLEPCGASIATCRVCLGSGRLKEQTQLTMTGETELQPSFYRGLFVAGVDGRPSPQPASFRKYLSATIRCPTCEGRGVE